MRRVLLVAMLVACGDKDTDPSPGISSAPAGDSSGTIRELTGKVTATRGSDTRTLTIGNPVTADDVIDTGADGSVVIELAHNNALWSLEAGIKARVDQSVAWKLSKQAAAKPVDHVTSSAGRHADRQAADTQVTATERPPANTRNDAVAAGGLEEARRPSRQAVGPRPERPQKATVVPPSDPLKPSPPPPAPADPISPDSPSLQLTPDRDDITMAMRALNPKFKACAEKSAAKGSLKAQVKIGADGKVESVEIKQSVDPATDACVIRAIKPIVLPRSQQGITFSYPIVIG